MASMTQCAYHLEEARQAIAVAIDHLHKAEAQDVDIEVAGQVYGTARTNLHLVEFYCLGLAQSRQPDLDRERAAIDRGAQP